MKSIASKIEKAMVKIAEDEKYEKKLEVSQKFTRIYPFTTENIKGYLEQYDFTNQTVLTVGASGDHILNLILLGATKIDYFDINPFTEFYIELKLAAVKALEYEEFEEYFFYNNWAHFSTQKCMDIKLYQKISFYLPSHIRTFWDSLYLEFSGEEILYSKLFEANELPSDVIKEINPYLNRKQFYRLKEKLLQNKYKLHFYEGNLKDLPSKLKKKYHAIILSNVAKYLQNMYDKDIKKLYKTSSTYVKLFKNTIKQLLQYVQKEGIIFVAYLYDTERCKGKHILYPIYDIDLREKYFPYPEYQMEEFVGIEQLKYDYQENDAVLVYKKNR